MISRKAVPVLVGIVVLTTLLLYLVSHHQHDWTSHPDLRAEYSSRPGSLTYDPAAIHHSISTQHDLNLITNRTAAVHHTIITQQDLNSSNSMTVNTEPMVLTLHYWEQIGNALKNLIDVQCWAKSVNISKVVEPSVIPISQCVFHFSANHKDHLKFRDLYDFDSWNSLCADNGYAQLASQEHFMEHATREIIYVWFGHCTSIEELTKKSSWYKFLTKSGFRVVKIACIYFHYQFMSEEKFLEQVFGDYMGQNVSVVFEWWRGIRGFNKPDRVSIENSTCSNCLEHLAHSDLITSPPPSITYVPDKSENALVPSQRVTQHVKEFIRNYLADQKYIAIMLRTEKLKKSILSESYGENKCLHDFLSDWNSTREKHRINQTLFFSDVGNKGSMKWNNQAAYNFSRYVQDTLRPKLTTDKINTILENSTGSGDRVHIAVVSREIVARATCVIMVGGGSFQLQTASVYALYHRGEECYSFRGKTCGNHYLSTVYGRASVT